MPFLRVVVQTGKEIAQKVFFIFQIFETGSHYFQSMCFQLHKLDFHIWKVEPTNSLTKRTAQIGRRIQYVDVFKVPQNRESLTGMQSLSFYNGVLPCNIFKINSGMLTSF